MITIRHLNLSIKKTPILNDINLDLHSGEIIGITGPAGCGKSSLIRAVCGVIKTQPGTIVFRGRGICKYRKKELNRAVSLLAQPFEYNPESTVFEETLSGRKYLKKFLNPYSEMDRDSTSSILEDLGIYDKSDTRLKRGNESLLRMTLAGRTLNSGSEIIAFDSPESGLDPAQRVLFSRAVKKHALSDERIILISSTDLDFLVKISDRIIIMQNGAITGSGSSDIINEELIMRVFRVNAMIVKNIVTGLPEIHIIDSE